MVRLHGCLPERGKGMRLLTALLICAILLTGCWTGAVRVKGVYTETMMNNEIRYYADLMGRDDIRITLFVYEKLVEYFKDFEADILYCDFEKLPGADEYDDLVYCDEGR